MSCVSRHFSSHLLLPFSALRAVLIQLRSVSIERALRFVTYCGHFDTPSTLCLFDREISSKDSFRAGTAQRGTAPRVRFSYKKKLKTTHTVALGEMVRRNRLDSLIRSRTLIRLMSIPKRKGKQRRKKFEHDKPAHNLSMFAIFETSSCLARAFFDEWKTVICTVRKAISPNESSWVEEAMPSRPSVVGNSVRCHRKRGDSRGKQLAHHQASDFQARAFQSESFS